MTVRLWCGECRKKQQHRCNGIAMWICKHCGCYRDLSNARNQGLAPQGVDHD